MWVVLLWLHPPAVFNSQSGLHLAFGNSSNLVQVFLPKYWYLRQFLLMNLCYSSKWQFSDFACLSKLGSSSCLCSSLSHGCKNCCYFSLFSFILVRMKWRLLTSLHLKLKTNYHHFILRNGQMFLFAMINEYSHLSKDS